MNKDGMVSVPAKSSVSASIGSIINVIGSSIGVSWRASRGKVVFVGSDGVRDHKSTWCTENENLILGTSLHIYVRCTYSAGNVFLPQ